MKWIAFIAKRYIISGRKEGGKAHNLLAVAGIAIGVMALIVIIAVMNGLQMGFIESIVEVASYHVRLDNTGRDRPSADALSTSIQTLPNTVFATPFVEFQGLLGPETGDVTRARAAMVRGLPQSAYQNDAGFHDKLDIISGNFTLMPAKKGTNATIVMGADLARSLYLTVGDSVRVTSIAQVDLSNIEGSRQELFTLAGTFRTDFSEYDSTFAFINIDSALLIDDTISIGVKMKNRFQDALGMREIEKLLGSNTDIQLRPWRDYNRSYFGALRTEKLMMFILVGLIFIVVGVNIFQAQRRTVTERREEIGLLKAFGAREIETRLVFLADGFIIGFAGAVLGLALGLLLALNVQSIFGALERLLHVVLYIKEVPSRVVPHEVVLIFAFGLLSALAASWFASGKTAKERPAEVLRNE
ncbi:MAG: ABC transporter permease [Spirochaetaceae bacterium]|jgi:lipoprotein-releasing system permease protein|nr:ABC transporter permease [Spirochaetaceae bacterium]